jgi:hypothetical protein
MAGLTMIERMFEARGLLFVATQQSKVQRKENKRSKVGSIYTIKD